MACFDTAFHRSHAQVVQSFGLPRYLTEAGVRRYGFSSSSWRMRQAAPSRSLRFGAPEVYTPKHLADKILTSKGALEGERKQVTVLPCVPTLWATIAKSSVAIP